ncbi:MAG TPA: sigma-54 dependent transcriptional regulator [Terriglobales bacterium]|nr:sigma-54 dependent transcriptional regulator [Terriglobales bacterium]
MIEKNSHVLVVDDDPAMRVALHTSFQRHGWHVEAAAGAEEALGKFRHTRPPLVVTDIRMPDGDGLTVLRDVRAIAPRTAVILLTAFGNVPEAVEAMKSGACDYLIKPIRFDQLQRVAERVMASAAETAKGVRLVGHSPALLHAVELALQAAASDADVLIEAESGTGKELLARLIHHASARAPKPFVAINCSAFPETLLESELFGHVRGAFTGAMAAKAGKFELANGGTLLLDDVSEMPLSLQPKLLRALQEREVDRLGDTRPIPVDLRVIATSNRPLLSLVEEEKFRADLYYRLNVIPLSLPPLRDRREDIPELAEYFVRQFATRAGGVVPRIPPELMSHLVEYSWPGNVRELANCIRRVVALSPGPDLALAALPEFALASASPVDGLHPGLSLRELEKRLLEKTLEATAGNRSRTAELLGVSLRTVRNKIRDYGLPPRRMYGHD